MDGLHGTLIQDGLGSSGQFHVMIDVSGALFWIKSRHMVSNGDTLVEGFHDGKIHGSSQIALTGKDQDEGVIGIHLEIGQKSEFLQGSGLKQMGLVDDQENGFSDLFFGLDEGLLDLLVDSALGDSVAEPYQTVDVTKKIRTA